MDPETENPQADPEAPVATLEAPEGTGSVDERSQPEDNPNPDEDEDPFEVAYKARRALEDERSRDELLAEAKAQYEREQEALRSTERSAEEQRRLNDSFTDAIKKTREGLKTIKVKTQDDEVIEVNLPDEMIEELVVKPFQAHNSVVSQAEQQRVLSMLGEAAIEVLPSDARDDFIKRASQKDLKSWIREHDEVAAPHTDYVRNLQKEIDAKVKAAEARGYARGQKAPAGTPHVPGERPAVSSAQPNLNTPTGLIAAQRAGQISDEEFRAKWAAL